MIDITFCPDGCHTQQIIFKITLRNNITLKNIHKDRTLDIFQKRFA
jgi:hypothetical protein